MIASKTIWPAAALAAAICAGAGPASALNIILRDTGGVAASKAETGFRLAARYWGSVLNNNAQVRIDVGFADLGANALGATQSRMIAPVTLADFRHALATGGASALDAKAVASLPGDYARVLAPGYAYGRVGIDPFTSRLAPDSQLTRTVALTAANARALGVDVGPEPDAAISLSSAIAFDFDPTDGIAPGKVDFLGVAIHEIGHALGFFSGVEAADDPGLIAVPIDDLTVATSLDLFRYSAPGQMDWRPGADSYFSIDGGRTAFDGGAFSTGQRYGDGWQASHWRPPGPEPLGGCENVLGIMNPYFCEGVGATVSGLDLAAFDAIGWNSGFALNGYSVSTADIYRANISAAPEPASWSLLIGGFGLAGSILRRRRGRRADPPRPGAPPPACETAGLA